jgi:hypothetical protein
VKGSRRRRLSFGLLGGVLVCRRVGTGLVCTERGSQHRVSGRWRGACRCPDDPRLVLSHLALDWEEPTWVRWVERLASFARLVRIDKRWYRYVRSAPGIPTPDESGWRTRGRSWMRLA